MSPETIARETLPALNVAAEGLLETRKEAFFLRKLGTAKGFSFEEWLSRMATEDSTLLACW